MGNFHGGFTSELALENGKLGKGGFFLFGEQTPGMFVHRAQAVMAVVITRMPSGKKITVLGDGIGDLGAAEVLDPGGGQFDAQGETFDQSVRKRCYDRIQEIFAEEQPYLFLYVPDALPIVHARFRGVEVAPLGIGHNLIKWYVPKAEQKLVMKP